MGSIGKLLDIVCVSADRKAATRKHDSFTWSDQFEKPTDDWLLKEMMMCRKSSWSTPLVAVRFESRESCWVYPRVSLQGHSCCFCDL